MYEQFFGFAKRPFSASPNVEAVIEHTGYVAARDALQRCLTDGSGIAILTAAAGLGKSLMCHEMQRRLGESFRVACLCSGQFPSRKPMLQAILFELRSEFHGLSDDEAHLKVMEAARAADREGRSLVLIVDEAHLMPTPLLDELRTLMESSLGTHNPVRLMFSAQLMLEERLGERDLEAFRQRIGCHVVLDGLTRDEARHYITERVKRAGSAQPVFSPKALDFIIRAADGIPRCINQLCDHSLLSSYTSDEMVVSEETARGALGDLRALPLHWNDVGLADSVEDAVAVAEDDGWEAAINEIAAEAVANRIAADEEVAAEPVEAMSADETEAAEYDPALVGVLEIGLGDSKTVQASDLFRAIDPWPAPAPVSEESHANGTNERSDSVEEFVPSSPNAFETFPARGNRPPQAAEDSPVDDLYASLDRETESIFGGRIPEAPDLMAFLAHFTGQRPGTADIEEDDDLDDADFGIDLELPVDEECADAVAMLETIRQLQAQLRNAGRAHHDDDRATSFDVPRYDLCEPEEGPPTRAEHDVEARPSEETAPAPIARDPEPAPQPTPPSPPVAAIPMARTVEIHPAHDPLPRFANLFTRLRQQRRATRERLAAETDLI